MQNCSCTSADGAASTLHGTGARGTVSDADGSAKASEGVEGGVEVREGGLRDERRHHQREELGEGAEEAVAVGFRLGLRHEQFVLGVQQRALFGEQPAQ